MQPVGTNSAASLPKISRGAFLQAVDGGIFAVNVVADFRCGHGAAHFGVGRVTVSLRRSTAPSSGVT